MGWLDRSDDDPAFIALSDAEDADELSRRLLASPWGWRSNARYGEAVDLLCRVRGSGTLPDRFVALLLCTCHRWDRVTAKLIAAIEDAEVLGVADLDELAESLLAEEVAIQYPLAWVSPAWLGVDLSEEADGLDRAMIVDESTMAWAERHPEPPLRRWAAARILRNDPRRLGELLATAETMPPRHRDALVHGLLDAVDAIEQESRRGLVQRALRCGIARVRRAALDELCKLEGPEAALQRARTDADRTVRDWRPSSSVIQPELLSAGASVILLA